MFSINGFIFVFATLILLISSLLLSSKIKFQSLSDKYIFAGLWFYFQMIFSLILCGTLFQTFSPKIILSVQVILFIIPLLFFLKFSKPAYKHWGFKNFVLTAKAFFSSYLLILLVLFLFLLSIFSFTGLEMPLPAGQAIVDHFPVVAHYFQESQITQLPMPSEFYDPQLFMGLSETQRIEKLSEPWIWQNSLPKNGELIVLWQLVFTGKDTWIDLAGLPFILFFVLVVYGLCRKLDFKQHTAILAALVSIFAPVLLLLSRSNLWDLAYAVFVLASIHFVLGWSKAKDAKYLLAALLAANLAWGTKMSGLLLVLFVFCLLGYHLMQNNAALRTKKRLGILLVSLSICIMAGGFWYLRNVYVFGNPFYPYHITVAGFPIFNGLGSLKDLLLLTNLPNEYMGLPKALALFSTWLEVDPSYHALSKMGGFGPLFFILGLPAFLFYALRSIQHSEKNNLLFIFMVLLLFLMQAQNFWPKNSLILLALAAVSIASLLEHAVPLLKHLLLTMICCLSLYTSILSVLYSDFGGYFYAAKKIPLEERSLSKLSYPAYTFADTLAPNTRIAFGQGILHYPLFSPQLKHTVRFVDAQDANGWLTALRNGSYDVVVIAQDKGSYAAWIRQYAAVFKLLYQDETLAAYALQKEGESAP